MALQGGADIVHHKHTRGDGALGFYWGARAGAGKTGGQRGSTRGQRGGSTCKERARRSLLGRTGVSSGLGGNRSAALRAYEGGAGEA